MKMTVKQALLKASEVIEEMLQGIEAMDEYGDYEEDVRETRKFAKELKKMSDKEQTK